MTQLHIEVDGIGFVYPPHISAREFDEEVAQAKCSHGMKSVDLIFDLPDRIFFVELKNPDNPKAAKYPQRQQWLDSFKCGKKDEDLCGKFQDTFVYEWAKGRLNKPVFYIVIVAVSGMEEALLGPRNEALSQMKPFNHPIFKQRPTNTCQALILNIETFNALMSDIRINRHGARRL